MTVCPNVGIGYDLVQEPEPGSKRRIAIWICMAFGSVRMRTAEGQGAAADIRNSHYSKQGRKSYYS